nr:glycosyltransferase [Gammaproteobacteria bacterium]
FHPMNFSVLVSVYLGTKASELATCFESLLSQTLPAKEIVVVIDGPLTTDTEHCLNQYCGRLPIKLLPFPTNRGLGLALRDGLVACEYELIARVDSDDISLPQRFQKQATFMMENSTISIVGSALCETYYFRKTSTKVIRNVPKISHLGRGNRIRNPLNHPTVMYRKSHVVSCGNYENCKLFEDYLLWAKLIQNGYKVANLCEPLVETTVDNEYFKRRGGIKYIINEIALCKRLLTIKYFSKIDAATFLCTRIPLRLIPNGCRKLIYRTLLRSRSN